MNKEWNVLIGIVSLWCLGLVLAPLTSGSLISDLLYKMYSSVCHQFSSRSFHLGDSPFAVCIRCTSIYFGFLSALIVLRFSIPLRSKNYQPVVLLLIVSFPMFADGMLSLLNVHESTTLSRIGTGSFFGIGMALLLHQTLTDSIHTFLKRVKLYEPETR